MLTVSNISAGVYSDDVNVFGEIVLSETYPTPSLGSTLVTSISCTSLYPPAGPYLLSKNNFVSGDLTVAPATPATPRATSPTVGWSGTFCILDVS